MDEKHPIKAMSPYGISKHTPEHYIKMYSELYDLKYTILRYANVYGPRQDPKGEGGVVSVFVDKMLAEEKPVIFGDGEQTRDFIYVADLVKANLMALDQGDIRHSSLANSRAKEMLGWTPAYDFKSGLEKTVEYYSK